MDNLCGPLDLHALIAGVRRARHDLLGAYLRALPPWGRLRRAL
jgi:hypothetical protein